MKRSRVLIRPGFQLRLVGAFLGMAVLALGLQLLILGFLLRRAAISAEAGTGELVDAIPSVMLQVGALSAAILIPVLLALGILRTFRVAGPIHRFERYLGDVAVGRESGPCAIRKGDDLQVLCERINAAVTYLKSEQGNPSRARDAA